MLLSGSMNSCFHPRDASPGSRISKELCEKAPYSLLFCILILLSRLEFFIWCSLTPSYVELSNPTAQSWSWTTGYRAWPFSVSLFTAVASFDFTLNIFFSQIGISCSSDCDQNGILIVEICKSAEGPGMGVDRKRQFWNVPCRWPSIPTNFNDELSTILRNTFSIAFSYIWISKQKVRQLSRPTVLRRRLALRNYSWLSYFIIPKPI